MPLGMILRRIWRERRLLSVLLLAICLVTGFFALGPLYVRAVSEAGVRYIVENTAPERLNITLSNTTPIGAEAWDVLNAEAGGIVTDIARIARNAGKVCGFRYTLGQATNPFTGRTPNCYVVTSFSNLQDIFRLESGRWPNRLQPPEDLAALAFDMNGDELSANQLGVYNRGEVEAVISAAAAAESNLEVGNRVVVGVDSTRTAIVHIVGIVEPAIPLDDPFWEGQRVVVSGENVPISLFEERYDFGLIVPDGAYEDWIMPNVDSSTFIWQLTTDPDIVHADTVDRLEQQFNRMQAGLQGLYPGILMISGLPNLIGSFRAGLGSTEGPIILLSGAVLVLMLYHLVTTVGLVLEQQASEWSTLSSRGGNVRQLITMQFLTVGALGVVGFVVGPFIAQGILLLLERVGPLTVVLGGASLGMGAIPPLTFGLSAFAALAAVIVLTLPAWPAARQSLLRLKQLVSRPPVRPGWARYALDFVLLLVGVALMLRLYFMIGGDVGESLEALIADPASLIRIIAAGAQDVGGLSDPFNLLGPALVLTGAALLWLRFFPLLMRLFSAIFGRRSGLTVPLALWSVERDPGHYAQLVLLLIGTLSLGTASLALSATRDIGAWTVARDETGATVRIETNPREADPNEDWLALPDVENGAALMVASTTRAGGGSDTVLGIDPESFGAAFPEWEPVIAPLVGTTAPQMAGVVLPDDTTSVTVQVYAMPSDEPTSTELIAYFTDALGVPLGVPMTTTDPTDAGRFVTYTAALPEDLGQAPWRLTAMRIVSTRGELQDFTHTVYFDDWMAVNATGDETLLAGFEADDLDGWGISSTEFHLPTDLEVMGSGDQAMAGETSLRIDYRIRQGRGGLQQPLLTVAEAAPALVPVVLSEAFADYYGRRNNYRQPLEVGDEGVLDIDLPLGTVQVRYRVVGLANDFPALESRDRFLIAATRALRPMLNTSATIHDFYDWNQAWLDTATREVSPEFRAAVRDVPGVEAVAYAWEHFNEIQREPLPNAITGMLFAGFWVSLGLSVLDFAFYLAVTARRRAISFAVLQAMGWEARSLWGLLAVEQAALVVPALIVGVVLGVALAYLLLPFLVLIGSEVLRLPLLDTVALVSVLVVAFLLLLGATAILLRRMSINEVLRRGED
ncbi:MAG: FtsX-like permease family protein [Anaerolineae bacterium]|nr:FtsX-like permease family protein [Anaerolineae bacterium]